ncbi:HEAT repeat domain-containing protein [Streptomyces sp. bgisy022]|uniref:HEAT repeat domain-containing protein n=1 Tax=Streptomyces sp. bgisy022 TaxID=3413769 RepID=UPI003D73A534
MQEVVSINPTNGTPHPPHTRVAAALRAETSSVRLQAAMAAGSAPDPALLETLVERCAVEPDFFVRDMLTWALIRLPADLSLPRLREELASGRAQARSQALHTLSKIGDRRAYGWITRALLHDADEVARTAWRTAVALVPEDEEEKARLGHVLAEQLGRGDRTVRLSLSRALVDLGEAVSPILEKAAADPDPEVATHAAATELLRRDPEAGFDAAVEEAKRVVALGPERLAAAEEAAATAPPARDHTGGATGATASEGAPHADR